MAEEYVLLDTRKIDAALGQKDKLIEDYNSINSAYETAVNTLLSQWKGRGADAFRKDTRAVRKNLTSICDTLHTLCDMLSDCRDVFSECDGGLGDYNREQ